MLMNPYSYLGSGSRVSNPSNLIHKPLFSNPSQTFCSSQSQSKGGVIWVQMGEVLLHSHASPELGREVGTRLSLKDKTCLCRHPPTSFTWNYLEAESVYCRVVMVVLEAVMKREENIYLCQSALNEEEQMKEWGMARYCQ